MIVLYLVPQAYLQQLRTSLSAEHNPILVMTISGLVAQILKEGQISYQEDKISEEIALWQSVRINEENLSFFAPIAHYPGFIQELKWLFQQKALGEEIERYIPELGQQELHLLETSYQQIIKKRGLLDAPRQIRKACQLTQERKFFPDVKQIKLQGLGELSPLENELIKSLAQGRPVEIINPQIHLSEISVTKTLDPYEEVEVMGNELRELIKAGVSLEKIGVAFPNLNQYLPIILPVFEKLHIPWRTPTVSLQNTPLGKTVLSLLQGELEGWHKHHLQFLTAPGWGFPFGLTAEDLRLLRLAPPLKGLPAWRNYLGSELTWERILAEVLFQGEQLRFGPLRDFGQWLARLLDELTPERWVSPEENLEHWVELVKAWDGFNKLAMNLQEYEWTLHPTQFYQLLQALLANYQLQPPRVFAEQIQVMGVEQLGACTYEHLLVGGLIEGQFPHYKHAHWLTKTKTVSDRHMLYNRLIHLAPRVSLFYPEVDQGGKLNLPATILPTSSKEDEVVLPDKNHQPSLFFSDGILREQELLIELRERILSEGLSVSQLNSYANCPYQFFCGHVLQLSPEEEVSLELDARARGNIIHDVLQSFWTQYLSGPLPNLDRARTEIESLLQQEYSKKGETAPAVLVRQMRDFIRKDLNLVEVGFRPKYLEQWFQGLPIVTSFGTVEIRGRIDRIDVHPDGSYVLYDYKTGAAPSLSSMLNGDDVQMATYLLAAHDLIPAGQNVGVAYYLTRDGKRPGIFRQDYQKSLVLRKSPNLLTAETFATQQTNFNSILAELVVNILQGKFPIQPASSTICKYCPFQGICRKEVGVS